MSNLSTHGWSPAMRRYQLRFWPMIAVYAVLLLAAARLIKHGPDIGAWRYAAALVPALPLAAIIISIGLYVREEADEFRRATYVHSMLWGLGVILMLTTVWGFLELLTDAPHLAPWWIFPIYCVAQDAAHHLIRRWYR